MSNAPHLLAARTGAKFGDVTLRDSMAHDGLWDAFTDQAMGGLTEAANTGDGAFSRQEQDEFAARSHQLAARAWKDGIFDDEVVPVPVTAAQGRAAAVLRGRGHPPRHHSRVARTAEAGLLAHRHPSRLAPPRRSRTAQPRSW
jgi:acetyl-CoA C-acetyltransferase